MTKRKDDDMFVHPSSSSIDPSQSSKKNKKQKKLRIGETTTFGGFDQSGSDSRIQKHNGEDTSVLRPSVQSTPYGYPIPSEDIEADVDAAEEEEFLEKRKRRGGVKADVYASDDDDEDQDVDDADSDDEAPGKQRARKAAQKKDDDDMFGGDDIPSKTQKKKKKILEDEDIEGQELPANGEEDSGEKIEPFHMKQEMEEGDFDESGHYIRKKDEFAIHDSWLQGVSKSEVTQAKRAHELQMARTKAQESQESKVVEPKYLWYTALTFMKPRETLLNTIARLGGNKKKIPKWKQKQLEKKSKSNKPLSTIDNVEEANMDNGNDTEKVTAIANQLFDQDPNSYDKTYEQIVRLLRLEDLIPDDWIPGTDLAPLSSLTVSGAAQGSIDVAESTGRLFEYKWGMDDTEIHGPFSESDMKNWKEQGFFAQGNIVVRVVTSSTPLDTKSGFVPLDDMKL